MRLSGGLYLLQRLCMGLASRWRNLFYRAAGVRIHGYVWMRSVEIPRNRQNIELTSCSLDRGVVLLCSGPERNGIMLSIGSATYLNRNTIVDVSESVTIGAQVAIGPGCYITDHDHGTNPALAPLEQAMFAKPTTIGDKAWLGANVVVLKGVTVGEGTIVGAGSVVTKDLPPYVIAAGIPAKIIRSRQATSVGESSPVRNGN